MSTRSKARAAAANATNSSTPSNTTAAASISTMTRNSMDADAKPASKKENGKVPSRSSIATSKKKSISQKVSETLCNCGKGDDGSPMILCSECNIWYHFNCVKLDEDEAGDIDVYICPSCVIYSGRHSTMTWEKDIALLEEHAAPSSNGRTQKTEARTTARRTPASRNASMEESEESSSSEDEYVDVNEQRTNDKRLPQSRQPSEISDAPARHRRASRVKSPSPAATPHGHLKRKASNAVGARPSTPPPKKKRAATISQPAEDPARKFCIGKFEEMFKDVFMRYPHVKVQPKAEDMDSGEDGNFSQSTLVSKKPEELGDDEKEALNEEARQFAKDLEMCVFEIYSEPDKNGNPHAGAKYKERFRMLQFNLSKPDRVMIHQRIASGSIAPKEISMMSSTELADEETQESIKLAEKEALEHSILLKSTAPRAKITHKGLQDIEDVNGDIATAREIEKHLDREQVEEERRERERMARLRTTQRQRTASISVPPESPSSQQGAGEVPWGAPPPVPVHAMSPTTPDFTGKMMRPQLSMQTSFEIGMEPDIDLSDFINMDGDQEPSSAVSADDKDMTATSASLGISPTNLAPAGIPPVSPIGISPFASQAERQRAPSFDLNSLWTPSALNNEPTLTEAVGVADTPIDTEIESPLPFVDEQPDDSDKEDAMDLGSSEENDQDFDMFLDQESNTDTLIVKPIDSDADDELIVTPLPPKNVEGLPAVWTGKLNMPLDSLVPQETTMVARQVAGKPLAADSPLWGTLFPTDVLRIEGRVPVENAIKYLMQMRFNATKELYAASFAPSTPASRADFDAFCNFLITKSRHGLIFPWGQRPKDYHPGRELYMVPLPQSEKLPEFIEVLDDLKLPKIRDKDYLIGIWIINKGKLAVLPKAPAAPSPPVLPFSGTPPVSQSPSQNLPSFQSPPHLPPPPTPPVIPGLPSIAPDTLAAEVASLTSEQIQELLKTLTATTAMHTAPAPPMPPFTSLPPASALRPQSAISSGVPGHIPTPPPGHLPQGAPQPWMHGSTPPGPAAGPPFGNFPPPNVPFQQAHSPAGPPSHEQGGPYGRSDYGRGQPQDYDNNKGPNSRGFDRDFRGGRGGGHDRGWRGGPGNQRGAYPPRGGRGDFRGRGRGGSRDGQDFGERRPSADSGWQSRRQRTDSQGGPQW